MPVDDRMSALKSKNSHKVSIIIEFEFEIFISIRLDRISSHQVVKVDSA
jgi:hypothetical protein